MRSQKHRGSVSRCTGNENARSALGGAASKPAHHPERLRVGSDPSLRDRPVLPFISQQCQSPVGARALAGDSLCRLEQSRANPLPSPRHDRLAASVTPRSIPDLPASSLRLPVAPSPTRQVRLTGRPAMLAQLSVSLPTGSASAAWPRGPSRLLRGPPLLASLFVDEDSPVSRVACAARYVAHTGPRVQPGQAVFLNPQGCPQTFSLVPRSSS